MTALLFDENLSHRLPARLAAVFPGSVHVRQVGLLGASDDEVWRHAAREGLVIVSKDDDFRQRSFLRGAPPKVVWLVLGNASTNEVAGVLAAGVQEIKRFVGDAEAALLVLKRTLG